MRMIWMDEEKQWPKSRTDDKFLKAFQYGLHGKLMIWNRCFDTVFSCSKCMISFEWYCSLTLHYHAS